ncbi:MAG: hypothetical protein LBS25_07895 [Candidatus Symbiothrix sp.]|jgi:hypothetical protein|nr:hypothetical protein [Candidatus Symbiothrix sp.]
MYKRFTQNEDCYPVMKQETTSSLFDLTPRKETLAFLLQFACSYHVEERLPVGLSGFILN